MNYNEELDIVEESEEQVVQDHPTFVCNTVLDMAAQGEITKCVMGKSALGTDMVMYGMCLIIGGYLIADSIIHNRWASNALMLGVIVFLAIMTFVLRKTSPKKALKRWEDAIIQRYGSPALHITTEFYNLSMAQMLKEDEEQTTVDGYSSIREMKESENFFLLRHGKTQYYIVSKKGFTTGTADQFRTFITGRIGGK